MAVLISKCGLNDKRSTHSKDLCICQTVRRKEWSCPFIIILLWIHLDVIVVALVSLVGYFSYQDAHYNIPLLRRGDINEISVYCDDISLGPDDDAETFDTRKTDLSIHVNKDGRYICKYKMKQVKEIVQKVVERTSLLRLAQGIEDRQYLSCGNASLAAKSGHLTFAFSGVSRHQNYKGNGKDLALHWDKHPKHSYIVPNMLYHNGEITIPEGRAYYIYASVHFNISRGDDKIDRPRKFTLRICRKVYGYEQTLLGKTQLFNTSHGDVASSLNVGSYLQMSRNDTIYVKVSDAFSIIRESRGNTFGMFPLSA